MILTRTVGHLLDLRRITGLFVATDFIWLGRSVIAIGKAWTAKHRTRNASFRKIFITSIRWWSKSGSLTHQWTRPLFCSSGSSGWLVVYAKMFMVVYNAWCIKEKRFSKEDQYWLQKICCLLLAAWHPDNNWSRKHAGGHLNIYIYMLSYQYRNSHYKDKTVSRLFHWYDGNAYTGTMASLVWRPLPGNA